MTRVLLAVLALLFLQALRAQEEIPSSFDAREKWPFCKSTIGQIRNQLNCSGDWAFALVSTMSDILCIRSSGQRQYQLSPQDLISCCKNCGVCEYTNLDAALERAINSLHYYIDEGIVSGGDYPDGEGCLPFSEGSALRKERPACPQQCQGGSSLNSNKTFGESFDFIKNNATEIQKEIMTNGPVITGFVLYQDYIDYTGGVYQSSAFDGSMGFTYGKVIGWGTEDGVPYWLIANSWGPEWGEKGFVKFFRGSNLHSMENWIIAVRGSGAAVFSSWFLILFSLFFTRYLNQ